MNTFIEHSQLLILLHCRLPISLCISLVCVQLWLHVMLPVEDVMYKQQYHSACYYMAFACLIEFCAEAPNFVSQVFCFVKLKVVMSTLQILVRSSLFLCLVLRTNSSNAIQSFALAQLVSVITLVVGYYGFYHFYIIQLKKFRELPKKNDKTMTTEWSTKMYGNMDDFPFKSVLDFLPGVMLKKKVSIFNLFAYLRNIRVLLLLFNTYRTISNRSGENTTRLYIRI